MPQIFIDADNFNFISDPAFKSTTGSYTFKRGDRAPLYLNFVSGNTVLSAVPGKTIKFGVKKLGEYDSTFVVSTSAYTINTSPFTGLSSYLLQPSFNTVELNQLLSAFDNDPGNDQASITLMGEITVSDDGVNFDSTNTVNIVVNNDVIRNDESTPLINPSPVEWLCTNLGSLSCGIIMNNPVLDEGGPYNNIAITGFGGSVYTNGEAGEIATYGISAPIYTTGIGSPIYTDASTSTIYTYGESSSIYTQGSLSNIITYGYQSPIYTEGQESPIYTNNEYSSIYTNADYSSIYTNGVYADIYAYNSNIYAENGSVYSTNGSVYSVNGSVYSTYGNVYAENGDIITLAGNIGIKTFAPDRALDVNADTIKIRNNRTISSATATGTQGDICFDNNYIYRCIANNTWKRSPLTTW